LFPLYNDHNNILFRLIDVEQRPLLSFSFLSLKNIQCCGLCVFFLCVLLASFLYFYRTILVYLTTNANSAATTFPLAKRYPAVPVAWATTGRRSKQAIASAEEMIYRHNRQHTRSVHTGKTFDEAVLLEEAAVEIWYRDSNIKLLSQQQQQQQQIQTGVRVLPREGHVIVFSGINPDNGYPNPRSFHGGEALMQGDGEKVLLSFFYEVPLDSFTSRAEFGQRVLERERDFLERHFSASKLCDNLFYR
jgi:hypothetical protein